MLPLKFAIAIRQTLAARWLYLLLPVLGLSLPPSLRGQVVINEIMADNASTLANRAGLFSDWVELYNSAAFSVNIGNWGLTDTVGTNKFTFPPNTLISPGGHILVWCDSTNGAGEFHAPFSLKSSGEYVGLNTTPTTVVDSITFGLQLTDRSIGRIPDGPAGVWTLNIPTPQSNNVATLVGSVFSTNGSVVITNLFLNEWVATNSVGPSTNRDPDWLEIYNAATNPVAFGGTVFTTSVPPYSTNDVPIRPLSFIDAAGFIKFNCPGNKAAKNGDDLDFKLSHTGGETVTLFTASNSTIWIDQISFPGDTAVPNYWPTDSANVGVSYGRLPDGGTNIVQFSKSKVTPAASNFQPLTNVVINEALSHTDLPFEDAIELYNPNSTNVDISYWWISNNPNNPKKFQIPPGTILPALGYKVFYEQRGVTNLPHVGFNTGGSPDGANGSPDPADFTLNSAHGDSVYLFTGDTNGALTGFRRGITFASAEHGVSFGRFLTSVGVDVIPMSRTTFGEDSPSTVTQFRSGTGLTNAYPKMGPLIISEIMYHPPDIYIGTTNGVNYYADDSVDEYIEVYNITTNTFHLWDTNGFYFDPIQGFYADGRTNTWHLQGMVDFQFPTNISLKAGEMLLLVNFDPVFDPTQLNLFRSKYGVPTNVQIFGPYNHKLSNSGGSVELDKPDPPQDPSHPDFRYVPYIEVDKITFNDKAPWPTEPDGGGTSLHRLVPERYGNEPTNWESAFPTPGWEPAGSISSQLVGNSIVLTFRALAGSTYSIQWKPNLTTTNWTRLTNVMSSTTDLLRVTNALTTSNRWYRLMSPAQ